MVALHRAVALAEVKGAEAALRVVDDLDLGSYHPFHAIRSDLLARLGRTEEAGQAFDTAARLTGNRSEGTFLMSRRDQHGWSGPEDP